MLKQERQAWLIVAVLFAALAFIFGGTIATPGIFFAPLIREFGWSRARVSSLASSATLCNDSRQHSCRILARKS